jgi:hypothetical protein
MSHGFAVPPLLDDEELLDDDDPLAPLEDDPLAPLEDDPLAPLDDEDDDDPLAPLDDEDDEDEDDPLAPLELELAPLSGGSSCCEGGGSFALWFVSAGAVAFWLWLLSISSVGDVAHAMRATSDKAEATVRTIARMAETYAHATAPSAQARARDAHVTPTCNPL